VVFGKLSWKNTMKCQAYFANWGAIWSKMIHKFLFKVLCCVLGFKKWRWWIWWGCLYTGTIFLQRVVVGSIPTFIHQLKGFSYFLNTQANL
jgi:hypothetical protein